MTIGLLRSASRTGASLLLLLVTLGPTPAHSDEPAGFRLDGTFRLAFVTVDVDAARLRPLVPPEFELVESAGRAVLGFALFPGDVSIDDGPVGSAMTTGVMTPIRDPAGTNDPTFYDLWWGTNGRHVADAFHGVGLDWDVAPALTYREQSTGPVLSVDADLPLQSAPHRVLATTHQPPTTDLPVVDRHYQLGRAGLVLTVYDHQGMDAVAVGTAEIHAVAGTPLAEVLGATSRSGNAFHFGDLRLIGRTEVVRRG